MKCTVLLFAFVLPAFLATGQNLVPNPSFEEFIECPDSALELDIEGAYPWESFHGSPDFFHECDETGMMSTPSSLVYGYQVPFHGVGQTGFIAQAFNPINREALGVELVHPLVPGIDYYVTMQIVRGWGGGGHSNCNCGVNNNGIKFTTRAYDAWDFVPIDNQAHIYQQEVYMDTVNWMQVHGWFTADSAYTHLAIGNFFEPAFNTVINLNGYDFLNTYYFVEAVCVSPYIQDCEWAINKIPELKPEANLFLFPNPFDDRIEVTASQKVEEIRLFDALGRMILSAFPKDSSFEMATHHLGKGLYMATVRFENGKTLSKKIIKN